MWCLIITGQVLLVSLESAPFLSTPKAKTPPHALPIPPQSPVPARSPSWTLMPRPASFTITFIALRNLHQLSFLCFPTSELMPVPDLQPHDDVTPHSFQPLPKHLQPQLASLNASLGSTAERRPQPASKHGVWLIQYSYRVWTNL